MQIKSIFQEISTTVFQMKNLDEAKTFITTFVSDRSINEKDKLNILKAVSETRSLYKLQNYLCNALLKYEGMSLTTPVKG